ncbi:17-beta-hydroxysteroid dehydrogenase type 2 isoform X2 [Candoia aspera]|uniref:17-beta-hydroxysteroid dehydrogenase type 2 isoform X2 n=1 Tax=Candoia aspera TaxID=51853 RepID=UPI002FD7C919
MFVHWAEVDNSLLIYTGATMLCGGAIFYRAKKNRMEKATPLCCSLLFLLTLEILCFSTLRSSLALALFSLACLTFCFCTPARALLPVDRKAVLITDLWGVINNAGILGFVADGELLPMSSYKQCMDVNFFGPVELSKTFLPLLRKSKGRLINISSMAGGIPMPRFAAYGASKAALSMFSGVIRQELSKWGIKVAVLHPSAFKSSIGGNPEDWIKEEQTLLETLTPDVKKDYGEDYIHNLRSFFSQMNSVCSPDLSPVFSDVLHALLAEHPKGLYTPGKNSYLYLLMFCCTPLWFYDFFMSKIINIPCMPYALRTAKTKNSS